MEHEFRIYLVDDDTEDREIFAMALESIRLPLTLREAKNGSQAIDYLSRCSDAELPNLVFLDLNMPQMGGKECLAILKKDSRLKHLPVIIYSTSSAASDAEETAALGAELFLTKPTEIDELIATLTEIINDRLTLTN